MLVLATAIPPTLAAKAIISGNELTKTSKDLASVTALPKALRYPSLAIVSSISLLSVSTLVESYPAHF